MNEHVGTEGLLKALQKLGDASYGHVLEYQPLGVVKNVLLLLLREQDRNVPFLQDQQLARSSLTTHQTVPTHDLIAGPKKRGTSEMILSDSKRARMDTTVQQDTRDLAAHAMIKKEPETIEITSDSEEPKSDDTDYFDTKRTRQPSGPTHTFASPYQVGIQLGETNRGTVCSSSSRPKAPLQRHVVLQ